MSSFTNLTDLAQERLGGRVLIVSDQFFGPGENLLKPGRGVFEPDRYTDHGKWMDGWESRRRRDDGHDWCIIRLGAAGVVRGVVVDTNHFRGNHPEGCSIDACCVADDATDDQLVDHPGWAPLLPRVELEGHTANAFGVESNRTVSHVRLNIYPDGGVARLRVHGESRPDWQELDRNTPVNLASAVLGGVVIGCSDRFFSEPGNMLVPVAAENMGDGWETRRRRGPGHDWCVIRLACRGRIERIEIDTTHFKGNYPDRCSIDIADDPDLDEDRNGVFTELLDEQSLTADCTHRFTIDPDRGGPCTHLRLNIYPDGGISRLRVLGHPAGASP